MLDITLVCVGRLKERFYEDAAGEYIKRLGAYCGVTVREIPEERRAGASEAASAAALEREAANILRAIPKGAAVVTLCVEGRLMSSKELSGWIEDAVGSGTSKLCFIIGGSEGLSPGVKTLSKLRLSMSPMTFPHHLARVMLLEQLYRAFSISSGGKYHK